MVTKVDGDRRPGLALGIVLPLAACSLLFHLAFAGQYGWFRDELYYIAAAKHLAGGYVEFPPMVALLAGFQRAVFGHSLAALHVLPAVAVVIMLVVFALMARELGGGRLAQSIAAPILPPKTLESVMSSPIQPIADRFGWPQLITTVATVYRALPAADRARATILAENYGEAGAFDLLGPDYGLPHAISPDNTYYFWGQGQNPGPVVITTGYDRSELSPYFRDIRFAATVPAQDGIQNEEVGRSVFICRSQRMLWAAAWKQLKDFS
jgi:hypothetical protein